MYYQHCSFWLLCSATRKQSQTKVHHVTNMYHIYKSTLAVQYIYLVVLLL